MSKNKGLTPKRKKIDRNPRVKHREKFRRAQVRRKGQVSVIGFISFIHFCFWSIRYHQPNGYWAQIICVRFVRCGVRRRDTVENGLVFVPELRGASNSSDKSTEDTHPSSNVILQWTFWCLCIGITDIMFNATAQTANEIKSSSDHSTMQNYFCIH